MLYGWSRLSSLCAFPTVKGIGWDSPIVDFPGEKELVNPVYASNSPYSMHWGEEVWTQHNEFWQTSDGPGHLGIIPASVNYNTSVAVPVSAWSWYALHV